MNNLTEYLGPKKAESLALSSGKGGAGKTVIALSMARVLAEAGVSVLFVDCDLATHGATYFMESELSGPFLTVTSLSGLLLQSVPPGPNVLHAKAGFDFIPSVLDPTERHEYPPHAEMVLDRWWSFVEGQYDAIILDCQAGYSDMTDWAAKVATRKLIVLEPDAVSAAAIRVLSLQLGYRLKSSSTWQVFNKLTEEERPIYERVAGGTLFTNLPPLPFDWQVRAAFALREIPGVLSISSAFGLGILRLMQTLFPRFSERLSDLEEKSVGSWYESIADRLQRLHSLRQETRYRGIEIKRRQRAQTVSWLAVLLGGLGVLLASYPIAERFQLPVPLFNLRFLVTVMGVLLVFISAIVVTQLQRGLRAEREQDAAQDELSKIEQDIRKFETLIASDPRLREYAASREMRPLLQNDSDLGEAPREAARETGSRSGEPRERTAVAEQGYRERPSGREIYEQIQRLPILSRKGLEDSYAGHLVRWALRLHSISGTGSGQAALYLLEGDRIVPNITCNVSLSEYPQLKRLHDGASLMVRGRIKRIHGPSIELADVELTFP